MEKIMLIGFQFAKTNAYKEEVSLMQLKLLQILLSIPKTLCEAEKQYLEKLKLHGKTTNF